jgi:hypothetical protein
MDFPARGGALPVDRFVLERRAWAGLKPWTDSGLVPHQRRDEPLAMAAAC